MTITHYDLIGDIHGQAEKLINLLQKLGYQQQEGVYQKPQHQVIFVGDFIDRGLQEKKVLTIVRAMIEANHAQAVMGNHEFNAICYHSKDNQGNYLRPHTKNNTQQHQHFLNEYPLDGLETKAVINWFKTLPLFLELADFRVIHACWDEGLIKKLKPLLTANNCLKSEDYQRACEKNSFFYNTLETLLKGPELVLPNNKLFTDKEGTARRKVRVRWWQNVLLTYRQAAVGSEKDRRSLSNEKLLDKNNPIALYPNQAIPVFFGHYWFSGTPEIASHNAVCLDYSAATQGFLIGYRLDMTEKKSLSNKNFYQSDI
ncbi:MAG: metallophosphoesterase [Methylococcales bacterium]|nr:metallophosphoesterase [Methylococcales bacterium]